MTERREIKKYELYGITEPTPVILQHSNGNKYFVILTKVTSNSNNNVNLYGICVQSLEYPLEPFTTFEEREIGAIYIGYRKSRLKCYHLNAEDYAFISSKAKFDLFNIS